MADLPAPEERGTLTIADKVVERIASIAAGEVGHTVSTGSGWSRVVTKRLPNATAKVAGDHARVGVQIAVAWPSSLSDVATRVRDHIIERVGSLTSIVVDAVDVSVADVVRPDTATRRVR